MLHVSAPPRSATKRTGRATFAPAVVDVAAALGLDLMPWQKMVLDVALEHVDGQLAYRDVILSVPRQGAKSTLLGVLAVWRMLASPGQRIAFAAQSRLAARNKVFDDFWPLIRRSSVGAMFELVRGTGNESIRCTNGSLMRILSTEESSGHGESLDLVLLDECWALEPHTEQAVRPAMVTRTNAQLWQASTAGTARSVWWRNKVEIGRTAATAGVTDGVAMFEWSADPAADPSDPATWWSTHPALGHTITEEVFAADFAAMTRSEFCRSHLNLWVDELGDHGWSVLGRDEWQAARL